MKGTTTLLAVLAVGALLMVGCAGFYRAPVMPGVGMLYSDSKAPVSTDLNGTAQATKEGRATAENIAGLVVVGDASIQAAAENGNITTIHYIDHEYKNILGLYAKFTTVVRGE